MPDLPYIDRSKSWLSRGENLIPGATQTLAKGPGQHVRGVSPVYAVRGRGAYFWDVDGNRFLDFNMGIGPLILGYRHPRVDAAIRAQLEDGITFSLMHPLEVLVAERVKRLVPNTEMVRFSKTGADVTSAAVRIARAHTGRSAIAACGYHGWHDWYIGTTTRSAGVPEALARLTRTFRYNDVASVEAAVDEGTAAVILEPMLFEAPRDGFLHRVREICDKKGALLIFDEMWTGFRLEVGGAQQRFGVRADLAVFSKAIANGMPLSALTGSAKLLQVLEQDVFFYTTFGGEALSLAAAKATLDELDEYEIPALLRRRGALFLEEIRASLARIGLGEVSLSGDPCRSLMSFAGDAEQSLLRKSFLQQELVRRGVLWSGQQVLSAAHGEEELEIAADAFDEALEALALAMHRNSLREDLKGEPVKPVFRTVTGR